jgi:hypothetical protein
MNSMIGLIYKYTFLLPYSFYSWEFDRLLQVVAQEMQMDKDIANGLDEGGAVDNAAGSSTNGTTGGGGYKDDAPAAESEDITSSTSGDSRKPTAADPFAA